MPNVMVSTSYRLVKRRKYRLNEIEELSLQWGGGEGVGGRAGRQVNQLTLQEKSPPPLPSRAHVLNEKKIESSQIKKMCF